MSVTSKYVEIEDAGLSATGKTRVWRVVNKRTGGTIGEIRWYGGWRKYAFFEDAAHPKRLRQP